MPKYAVRYLKPSEFYLWDEFVEEEKDGILFQRTNWITSIYQQQDPSIEFRVLVCINNKNGRFVGGLAFGVKKKLGLWIMIQPHNTPFSGFLISHRNSTYLSKDHSFRSEVMTLIGKQLEADLHFISIIAPFEVKDIRPFTWRNYKTTVLYTFYTDTLDRQQAMEKWNPDIRRQATKAMKQPISIAQGLESKQIHDFYKIQELSFKRQRHRFKFDSQAFEKLITRLSSTVNLTFYVAYKEGTPIAGQVILYHKKRAYYWLAGAHPDYLKSGANQAILKHIFKDFDAKGIDQFDFVGANTSGVADYKGSFNFPLKPYYHLTKIMGPYAKLLFLLKQGIN